MAGNEQDGVSSRRTFLKGGAVLAAPLAMVVPTVAMADDSAARLRRLEDEAAIRAVRQDWLRRVNGRRDAVELFVNARAAQCLDGAVCAITAERDGADRIEIATDGLRASGTFLCAVETESHMMPQNTFAQMALAQGGGVTRASEQRLVQMDYVKAGDRWLIAKVDMWAV